METKENLSSSPRFKKYRHVLIFTFEFDGGRTCDFSVATDTNNEILDGRMLRRLERFAKDKAENWGKEHQGTIKSGFLLEHDVFQLCSHVGIPILVRLLRPGATSPGAFGDNYYWQELPETYRYAFVNPHSQHDHIL